jgi:hypothetical protein
MILAQIQAKCAVNALKVNHPVSYPVVEIAKSCSCDTLIENAMKKQSTTQSFQSRIKQ